MKLTSLDRSEKVTLKYHIFIYVFNCFLCLIVKNVTLPEKDTILALIKIVFNTI